MPSKIELKLEAIRVRFLESCRDDLSILESGGITDEDRRAELQAVAHRIAGSAGIFGEDDLGQAAFDMESALLSESEPDPARIRSAHETLRGLLRQTVSR